MVFAIFPGCFPRFALFFRWFFIFGLTIVPFGKSQAFEEVVVDAWTEEMGLEKLVRRIWMDLLLGF